MNLKNYFSKELALFLSLVVLIILIFSFILFGVTGVRFVFGIIVMWLPFYLILNNFELTTAEKFVFSILMAITIFPSIAFLIGFVVSFKTAIIITFILLMIFLYLIGKFKHKK